MHLGVSCPLRLRMRKASAGRGEHAGELQRCQPVNRKPDTLNQQRKKRGGGKKRQFLVNCCYKQNVRCYKCSEQQEYYSYYYCKIPIKYYYRIRHVLCFLAWSRGEFASVCVCVCGIVWLEHLLILAILVTGRLFFLTCVAVLHCSRPWAKYACRCWSPTVSQCLVGAILQIYTFINI